MEPITLLHPPQISFGDGCSKETAPFLIARGAARIMLITSPPILPLLGPIRMALEKEAEVSVYDTVVAEPTIDDFEALREEANRFAPDAVIGIGGGSVLDTAKLVAAFRCNPQRVEETFGLNLLRSRNTLLVCCPTTSGTGSEVSPNAILLDEKDQLKKGVVSRFLVPDAAFVDPLLTHTAPRPVTAATGMDALVHCIEAYANKRSHPLIDVYALKGIQLIGASLKNACESPNDPDARSNMALGSLMGGLCLGPVNTAAIHALAYPLGGEFHVPHGVSNSVLLPAVFNFNLPASPQKYADIALALGAERAETDEETAKRGLAIVRQLSRDIGIPQHLSELDIPRDALPRIAESAMKVTRLLVNNLRELTAADAQAIYEAAY